MSIIAINNVNYMTELMQKTLEVLSLTSTAQCSTRKKQVIFAVLDVSLNNGP